jgi:hypothetical protein
MDLRAQFQLLGRKQLAAQEGVLLLQELRRELRRDRALADAWGLTAILANATLVPLNILVNAAELGAAKSLYEALVRELYRKLSASGTRTEGQAKVMFASLKQFVTQELKRKGAAHYVPGANILIGLAEDSLALLQAVEKVDSGQRELRAVTADMDRRIHQAELKLMQLGIDRASVLEKLQRLSRTA